MAARRKVGDRDSSDESSDDSSDDVRTIYDSELESETSGGGGRYTEKSKEDDTSDDDTSDGDEHSNGEEMSDGDETSEEQQEARREGVSSGIATEEDTWDKKEDINTIQPHFVTKAGVLYCHKDQTPGSTVYGHEREGGGPPKARRRKHYRQRPDNKQEERQKFSTRGRSVTCRGRRYCARKCDANKERNFEMLLEDFPRLEDTLPGKRGGTSPGQKMQVRRGRGGEFWSGAQRGGIRSDQMTEAEHRGMSEGRPGIRSQISIEKRPLASVQQPGPHTTHDLTEEIGRLGITEHPPPTRSFNSNHMGCGRHQQKMLPQLQEHVSNIPPGYYPQYQSSSPDWNMVHFPRPVNYNEIGQAVSSESNPPQLQQAPPPQPPPIFPPPPAFGLRLPAPLPPATYVALPPPTAPPPPMPAFRLLAPGSMAQPHIQAPMPLRPVFVTPVPVAFCRPPTPIMPPFNGLQRYVMLTPRPLQPVCCRVTIYTPSVTVPIAPPPGVPAAAEVQGRSSVDGHNIVVSLESESVVPREEERSA